MIVIWFGHTRWHSWRTANSFVAGKKKDMLLAEAVGDEILWLQLWQKRYLLYISKVELNELHSSLWLSDIVTNMTYQFNATFLLLSYYRLFQFLRLPHIGFVVAAAAAWIVLLTLWSLFSLHFDLINQALHQTVEYINVQIFAYL